MEQYTGAEAFIEVCNANGIDHIFFNPGGEFSAINAACLKNHAMGKPYPKLYTCLHESVALTAAHGNYMISGKPQVVLVHSELGTQQVGGALHNAQWGRIPVVLMAGTTVGPERVNWKGEKYDQAMLARNSVKWDYEITADDDIQAVMQMALSIAYSEPRGPVYLCYSPAVLTAPVARRDTDSLKLSTTELPEAGDRKLEEIAETLLAAENPLILAGYVERYRENIPQLMELAETLCASVVPGLTRMNFPTNHPLCAGMEEMGGGIRGNEPFAEADVMLVVDYDTPYVPAEIFPRKETKILQIDVDNLTVGRPLWGSGADLFLKADSRKAIPALTSLIRDKLTPEQKQKLQTRYTSLEQKHKQRRTDNAEKAMTVSAAKPVSPDWLGYCINEILGEDDILVNHLISQSSSVAGQVDRTKPGTMIACAGGSIMWALGAALGAKAAEPDKLVVSVMTDGGFTWGCPVPSLWSCMHYDLPILAIVFNNQSYGAIRVGVERMVETRLTPEMGFISGLDLDPPADFAKVAESCGGYGRVVTDPGDLRQVLKEAVEEVKNGRLAVIDVRLPLG